MTSMTRLPFGRPLTRADLEDLPEDDGHRYELIDGLLLVSPAPATGTRRRWATFICCCVGPAPPACR